MPAGPSTADPRFRRALRDDVPEIVRLLADDVLGAKREEYRLPLPDSYYAAFDAIERDSNNEIIIAELHGRLVGVLQITYIPYLTRRGSWRALLEGVRVDAAARGGGLGRRLIGFAVERARRRGCSLVQLTSDKSRRDALRFYQSLGFVASHEGLKLDLA